MYTKEEIVLEIKRTAEENEGKPLGYKNFQNATGIGWYTWGKYWPTWGQALVEAGYKPNEKYTAYTDTYIAEQMIGAIRRYGRYPTLSELRIDGINSGFPYDAIKKRKKYNVVKIICDFCKDKQIYTDVLEVCTPILQNIESKESLSEEAADKKIGYVYLIKSSLMHAAVYKVGKTYDVDRRLKELNQPSNDQTIIHIIQTDDPDGIETYWHKRFENKQYKNKNEWYILRPSDIKAFKRWKNIY